MYIACSKKGFYIAKFFTSWTNYAPSPHEGYMALLQIIKYLKIKAISKLTQLFGAKTLFFKKYLDNKSKPLWTQQTNFS